MTLPQHDPFPVFHHNTVEEAFHIGGTTINGMKFHDAGARSSEPALEYVKTCINAKLDELETRGLLLFQEGVKNKNKINMPEYQQRRRRGLLLDVRAIQLALTDIPRFITVTLTRQQLPTRVVRAHTSYGLKHHLETYRQYKKQPYRGYITNGDFCMAMLLLGFPIRRESRQSNKLVFKCASLVEKAEFLGSRRSYTAYKDQEAAAALD